MTDQNVYAAVLGFKQAFGKIPHEMTMNPSDWAELTGHPNASPKYGDLVVKLDPLFPVGQVVCWT